jgi:predicted lysophospholipase L1 biosynthesis ABC-type transport system permease subunit
MGAAIDAGADIIEIGVPWSDPSADGKAIQAAMHRALGRGGGLRHSLSLCRKLRDVYPDAGLVLFGYANPIVVMGADVFALRFAPDAPASSRTALESEANDLALEVVPLDRIEGAISDALDRIFGLFDALAAVAVLIAALGIVNTLTINVIERVREIGILRAAGMTRRQVWRSVVVEAGILGLAGALLGIVLGLVVGALMVLLAGDQLDIATGIPWSIIGLALVLGVAVAMIAAAYPARIASRLSIVRAVQYE